MKKVSVLGCGWLGLPLAARLAKSGYEVKGSTTSEEKMTRISSVGVAPFLVRLSIDGTIDPTFLDADVLILNIPPSRNSHEDFLAILQHLRTQVEESPIRQVLYGSSTSVYPSNNNEVTEDDADYTATSRSGIVLLETEDIWRNRAAFDHMIVRFAGLFGPERNPGRFLSGRNTNGGENPVNMIHLDDCIGIIGRLLQQTNWNDTFNACSPHHPTRKAFYQQASEHMGIASPVFEDPQVTPHKVVNAEKLISTLSYQFIRDNLFDAIRAS